MYYGDEWSSMFDGTPYDGKNLLGLVRSGKSPFNGVWDVKLLIQEIEKLNTKITGIPIVNKGSNNYGFHITRANSSRPDDDMIVGRLAQNDVNMPDFDSFPVEVQIPEVQFEMAVYNLLRSDPGILASRLFYGRAPVQYEKLGLQGGIPHDISGRRLLVFEKAEGRNNVWEELTDENKFILLGELAGVRAGLFLYDPPKEFLAEWFLERLFKFKLEEMRMDVAPTREFWMYVLEEKIKATIGEEGDMIGWEEDDERVGRVALAAKERLLRPRVTSVFDWETACIWPEILWDPLVAADPVDLIVDGEGQPAVTRIPEGVTRDELGMYAGWAQHYVQELYRDALGYETVIRAGKDFRYLWYALRDWRGGDSEEYFGKLGTWAEKLMQDRGLVGVN
ncbi:hypothetical protein QBC38DRAFT_535203 [Podospora fimiseda]|uniref:Uncharacterized protein n=1 Tax=Podospora fimiseda TaxID=252190 RepID=A0AAN7BTF4_9PEZI|nr:hypothetical protein QBC38DRAFT_535203 [Podospora fimiseda]